MSHFVARCASQKHSDMRDSHAFRVRFSHVRVFFSRNVRKRATKSDTSAGRWHCLAGAFELCRLLEEDPVPTVANAL